MNTELNREIEGYCDGCGQPFYSLNEQFGGDIHPLCRKCYNERLILKEVALEEVAIKLRKIIIILNIASRAHANAIKELYDIVGPPHDPVDITEP